MSNKVTSIKKAWNKETNGILRDLTHIKWADTLSADLRKDFSAHGLDGTPNALYIEMNMITDITDKVKAGHSFTQQDINAIYENFRHIGDVYAAQDTKSHEEHKTRHRLALAAISHTNNLLITRNIPRAQQTVPHNTDISRPDFTKKPQNKMLDLMKENARVTLNNLNWHETLSSAKQSRIIRAGWNIETFTINDLKDRITSDTKLDAETYSLIIMQFKQAHEQYLFSKEVEAEFAARQTLLCAPLRALFEHHADSNLFKTKDLEMLNEQRKKQELTEFGKLALAQHNAPIKHPENDVPLNEAKKTRDLAYSILADLGPSKPTKNKSKMTSNTVIPFPAPNKN